MGRKVWKVCAILNTICFLLGYITICRWYYQFKEERLPACTFNVHAFLHIPEYIRRCGPAWAMWAFPMERYCGKLGKQVKSRLHPYATLAHYMKRSAQLNQLKCRYPQIWELLSSDIAKQGVTGFEETFHECAVSSHTSFIMHGNWWSVINRSKLCSPSTP